MKKSHLYCFVNFIIVIAVIAAAVFLHSQIALYAIIAWTILVAISMSANFWVCKSPIDVPIDKNLIPKLVYLKYKIFKSYWTGTHLPVEVDAFFYFVIVALSGIGEMYFVSGVWVAIAGFDLKMRDIAIQEQAKIIVHSVIEKAIKEAK